MPPFARPGPSGRFPGVIAPTAALRLLDAPRSLRSPPRFPVPARAGSVEISQVPGQPFRCVSRARDPAGAAPSGPGGDVMPLARSTVAAVAFHQPGGVSPSTSTLSGLTPETHILAVYASQPPSRVHHARLASRRQSWALPGRDSHPRVASRGFSSLHRVLLSHALPGATGFSPGCPALAQPLTFILYR
jgi:hypothetical protein